MPDPMPPADRRHGSGDRNENEVARRDHALQEKRDARQARDAREAGHQARREEGFDHP